MSDELFELRKISKILTLANASVLEKELEKYATTNERKKMWVLINGERSPDDLIPGSGMKQAAVYKFLKTLSDADLVETPYGKPPKRKLDFIPASWLTSLTSEQEDKKPEVAKDVKTTNTNQ
jgi:hypothetical protein